MNIGKKIFEIRKEKGWTQEDLAEKLNVTRQTISNWETEQTVPDLYQAIDLSKAFGINVNELADLNNIIYRNDMIEPNLEVLFEVVLKNMKKRVSPLYYETWIKDLVVNSLNNDTLLIEVPTENHIKFIKKNIYNKLLEEFNKVSKNKIDKIELIINEKFQKELENKIEMLPDDVYE